MAIGSVHGRALQGLLLAAVTGDGAAMDDLVTDDVIGWSPNVVVRSRGELIDAVGQPDDTFSDIELNVQALDEMGDKAIAEWHLALDHTGPLFIDNDIVIPPTGRRLHLSGATIAEFDGDRICAFRSYFDDLALIEQTLDVVLTKARPRATAPLGGADHDLVGEADDDPAGSAAHWFRKRWDRPPGTRLKRWARATLVAGLVILLVAELIDGVRATRQRLAHLVASRWAHIERRERRHTRRRGIAALASRCMP